MEWQRRPLEAFYPVIHRGRDPRQGPRRPPGAGDARTRIAVGAGHGRRQARAGDLDPGRGGGLLEGRRVCARSGQQGGARGVLIVCCDGPAGLPEAARGGPGPTPWSPPAWSTPVRATRAVRRLRGPQGGRRRPAPEPAPPPTRRPPDGPQAPSASPTRAREHPQTAAGAGEGLGEEHRLPGLPPGPAPGHLCTTNAIESLNHRAARSAENRGHYLLRRGGGPNCCGRRVCNIEDRRAAERAKEKNTPAHSRRANGWTRRGTGHHQLEAGPGPARRRLPRPNQPPSLTEPAYTETLTGSPGSRKPSALSVSKYRVVTSNRTSEARPIRAHPASRRDRPRVKSSAA